MLEQHSDCVRISGEVNNATDDNPDFLWKSVTGDGKW
jgi:hypothetical protein